jgi:predicted nucleic acid-binding protein
MRYLLDTNVLSELVRPARAAAVVAWVRARSALDLALSVLTLGELEKGVRTLAAGTRRDRLTRWARTEMPAQFLGRVLSVDEEIAISWGTLTADAHAAGRPLPVIDGLLLATAATRGLTLVTRNVSDCARRGVAVFDPWTSTLHE